MLGVPQQGIHAYRFFDIAVMDVLMTVVGARIIHWYLFQKTNYLKVLLLLFVLGILLHRLFCVRTTIDRLLFA
jgi:mannose/fructose/N-acetylgalactosamine-specific phosphotransferase system component IID